MTLSLLPPEMHDVRSLTVEGVKLTPASLHERAEGAGPPVIDHCHTSGKVRGVLCSGCNIKLSAIEDRAFATAASEYLEASR